MKIKSKPVILELEIKTIAPPRELLISQSVAEALKQIGESLMIPSELLVGEPRFTRSLSVMSKIAEKRIK